MKTDDVTAAWCADLDHSPLESIRMLTNHDMHSASPLRLPADRPTHPAPTHEMSDLAALDRRIGLRHAMTPKDTTSYLRHRLSLAGRSDTPCSPTTTPPVKG